ncbi:MAG: methionine biosynthesis protein MetW, partial [Stenotrophobium sp.]
VMTQALQALQRPDQALAEILRVGKTGIVTFPNFGHWRVRSALARGRMPVTPSLPETWYNTPNIHLCTVADFEDLCRGRGWRIVNRRLLDNHHRKGWRIRIAPNLFSEAAMYMLQGPAK